jgi:hypothetical protein
MKFFAMLMMVVCSVLFTNAQTTPAKGSGGLKIDKSGVAVKGAKGGGAHIDKNGAAAKGAKGKGVEADKKGTRTTPAK